MNPLVRITFGKNPLLLSKQKKFAETCAWSHYDSVDFSLQTQLNPHESTFSQLAAKGDRQFVLLYPIADADAYIDFAERPGSAGAVVPAPAGQAASSHRFHAITMLSLAPECYEACMAVGRERIWKESVTGSSAAFAQLRLQLRDAIDRMLQALDGAPDAPRASDVLAYEIYATLGGEDLAIVWLTDQYDTTGMLVEAVSRLRCELTSGTEAAYEGGNRTGVDRDIETRAWVRALFQTAYSVVSNHRFLEDSQDRCDAVRGEAAIQLTLPTDDGDINDLFARVDKVCGEAVSRHGVCGEFDAILRVPARCLRSLFSQDGLLNNASWGYLQCHTQLLYPLDSESFQAIAGGGARQLLRMWVPYGANVLKNVPGGGRYGTRKESSPQKGEQDPLEEAARKLDETFLTEAMMAASRRPQSIARTRRAMQSLFQDLARLYNSDLAQLWKDDLLYQFSKLTDLFNWETRALAEQNISFVVAETPLTSLKETMQHVNQATRLYFGAPFSHLANTGPYSKVFRAYYGILKALLTIIYMMPHSPEQSELIPLVTFSPLAKPTSKQHFSELGYCSERIITIEMPQEALSSIPYYALLLTHELSHYICPEDRNRRNCALGAIHAYNYFSILLDAYLVDGWQALEADAHGWKEGQWEAATTLWDACRRQACASLGQHIRESFETDFHQRMQHRPDAFGSTVEQLPWDKYQRLILSYLGSFEQESGRSEQNKKQAVVLAFLAHIATQMRDEDLPARVPGWTREALAVGGRGGMLGAAETVAESVASVFRACLADFLRAASEADIHEQDADPNAPITMYAFLSLEWTQQFLYAGFRPEARVLSHGLYEASADLYMVRILDLKPQCYVNLLMRMRRDEDETDDLKRDSKLSFRMGAVLSHLLAQSGGTIDDIDFSGDPFLRKGYELFLREWSLQMPLVRDFMDGLLSAEACRKIDHAAGNVETRCLRMLTRGFCERDDLLCQLGEAGVAITEQDMLTRLDLKMVEAFQYQRNFKELSDYYRTPAQRIAGAGEARGARPAMPRWRYRLRTYRDENKAYRATSLEELLRLIETLSTRLSDGDPHHTLWFRGHKSSDYLLIPSLYRARDRQRHFHEGCTLAEFQRAMLSQYKSRATLHNELLAPVYENGDWLAVMQHYGICTNLLDFTENAMQALYFACEDAIAHQPARARAALYVLSPTRMNGARDQMRRRCCVGRGDWSFPAMHRHIPNLSDRDYERELSMFIAREPEGAVPPARPEAAYFPMAVHTSLANARIRMQHGTFVAFATDLHPAYLADRRRQGQGIDMSALALDQIQRQYLERLRPEASPFLYRILIEPEVVERLSDIMRAIGYTKKSIYPELEALSTWITATVESSLTAR